MAKKNNNQPAAAKTATVENVNNVAETTSENIVEQLKSENKMSDAILEKTLDLIQKEKDEKKMRELKEIITEADYTNKRELLNLRRRRAEEKATKEALSATKDILDELTSGKITPTEYRKKKDEVLSKKRDAFRKIENEDNEHIKELRDQFPGYWCWGWDRF